DERLTASQDGVVVVRAPADVHGPILAHASRRLRATGFVPIKSAGKAGAPLFREVAMHLGLEAAPYDPLACAEAIANLAATQRAAIVAPLPASGTWDFAVAAELARTGRLTVVFVTASEAPGWEATTFEIAGELTVSDKLRWWTAVAEEAQTDLPAADLRSLELWWAKARRVTPDEAPSFESLGDVARRVL